jgi:hypothetical protein
MNPNRFFALVLSLLLVVGLGFNAGAGDEDARFFDRSFLRVHADSSTIDISAADYTAWQTLVTIAPASNQAMSDVRVVVDLDKATTGFADATDWTDETLQISIARKVDGTNYRTCHNLITPSTAIAADDADGLSLEIAVGDVGPTEDLRIMVKVSAEGGADAVIPYVVTYKSPERATFTDVDP